MICIWSDISRHHLLFLKGRVTVQLACVASKSLDFEPQMSFTELPSPAPLVCRALRMFGMVALLLSCPVHTINCRALGPPCPWPFMSLICCANDVQETTKVGIAIDGYVWLMFYTSSRGNHILHVNGAFNHENLSCRLQRLPLTGSWC